MNPMLKDRRLIAILVLPAVILYTITIPIPVLWTFYLGFNKWDLLNPPRFIGLANYVQLFTNDPRFLASLRNTLLFVVGCVLLQIPTAFVLAYWLRKVTRVAQVFRSIYFFPVVVSGAAVGLIWQLMLQPQIGLVNGLIRILGASHFEFAWLGSERLAIWLVILATSWQYFGYYVLIFSAGLSTVSPEIYDAATVDGAGEGSILRHIVIPLLRRFVLVSLILITTSSITIFANVIALTRGGPGYSSEVLALHMYNESFFYQSYGYGSAIATVLFLLNLFAVIALTLALYPESLRLRARMDALLALGGRLAGARTATPSAANNDTGGVAGGWRGR